MSLKEVLKNQLEKVRLSEEEYEKLNKKAREFCENVRKNIKKKKIKADVFIGGSLAKHTIMKKKEYDIDIFVRFDKKYKDEEISEILGKLISGTRIHGSRDYFQIKSEKLIFEIIPIIKISSPKQARNVTDLSYFHVSYILGKIQKRQNLANEILLAKSFCYAQNCYGAESYIKGFSGYALELLVSYYGSFEKFLSGVVKSKEQIIIDPEKFYKNKNDILTSLNEAKLTRIVFVDPTFKDRNALAALSDETFEKFKIQAGKFLKHPNLSYFESQEINKTKFNLVLKARTDKQEGDIAGSKLLKFFNFVSYSLEKNFIVENKEFSYSGQEAVLYFNIKQKKEIIFSGPRIDDINNVERFKQKHKHVFLRDNRVFARQKPLGISEFIQKFRQDNKKVMSSMGVVKFDNQ